MATLRELLEYFSEELVAATIYPPDGYPEWQGQDAYENHMQDLRDIWAQIQPKLKHTPSETIAFINERLESAIVAFDAVDKEKGTDAILDIYNLDISSLLK